ncbi:MAG: hypothetical protein JSS58_02010, partial [Proteobacteria bacterium]|nr:hypothetical protein [Pseudomonadota bacterium]
MQTTQDISQKSPVEFGVAAFSSGSGSVAAPTAPAISLGDYRIIRRNGAVVGFEPSKIA